MALEEAAIEVNILVFLRLLCKVFRQAQIQAVGQGGDGGLTTGSEALIHNTNCCLVSGKIIYCARFIIEISIDFLKMEGERITDGSGR